MAVRIAAGSALLVFAVALLLGLAAENTFATTLGRALIAMAGTFVIGLVVGAMGEKMAKENLKPIGKNGENSGATQESGR
jgi:hypothetical protein